MPLQNRVDPLGNIHAVEARGMFTGNRGVIHDPRSRMLLKRRWSTRAWIICVCDYEGRKRDVMGRNAPSGNAGWTELFFLDEVTALAAGHRPCFFCRYRDAKAFAGHFGAAFGLENPKAADIDERLHRERLASGGKMTAIARDEILSLPDGAVVFDGTSTYAIREGRALRWNFDGYDQVERIDRFEADGVYPVTPASTLAALKSGYRPVWHGSSVE